MESALTTLPLVLGLGGVGLLLRGVLELRGMARAAHALDDDRLALLRRIERRAGSGR